MPFIVEVKHFRSDPKPVNFEVVFLTEENVADVARFLGCITYSLHVDLEKDNKLVRFFFKTNPREREDFTVKIGEAISRNAEDPDDDWDSASKEWTDTLVPVYRDEVRTDLPYDR